MRSQQNTASFSAERIYVDDGHAWPNTIFWGEQILSVHSAAFQSAASLKNKTLGNITHSNTHTSGRAGDMATADKRPSEITSEAYNLLDNVMSGLDDLIYAMAEAMASNQGSVNDAGETVVRTQDIRDAVQLVLSAISNEAARKQISSDDLAVVAGELRKVLDKCSDRNVSR